MYVCNAERQTAEVNEPKERTNANVLMCVQCFFFFLKKKNADSVTNVEQKHKRNICFLSSSLDRALINVGQTYLFPLLILDERVSNRIYANQLNLSFFFVEMKNKFFKLIKLNRNNI